MRCGTASRPTCSSAARRSAAVIQALLGHDKLDTTARYTRVATGMIARDPRARLTCCRCLATRAQEGRESPAAGVRRPAAMSRPGAGGRGYLSRPGTGMSTGANAGHPEPRPDEGDVGDPETAARQRSAARVTKSKNEKCAYNADRIQPLQQPPLSEVSGGRRPRSGWPRMRPSYCRCPTATSCSRCPAPIADMHLSQQSGDLRHPIQGLGRDHDPVAADPKHLGARIGITLSSAPGARRSPWIRSVHMIVPGGGISLRQPALDCLRTIASKVPIGTI